MCAPITAGGQKHVTRRDSMNLSRARVTPIVFWSRARVAPDRSPISLSLPSLSLSLSLWQRLSVSYGSQSLSTTRCRYVAVINSRNEKPVKRLGIVFSKRKERGKTDRRRLCLESSHCVIQSRRRGPMRGRRSLGTCTYDVKEEERPGE
jgi:hypothetical protein